MVSLLASDLPPPTTNVLSVRERAQLRRKAKKLEQILGSLPVAVDDSNSASGSTSAFERESSPSSESSSSRSSRPSTATSVSSVSSNSLSLSRTASLSTFDKPKARSFLRARRALSGDSWPAASPFLHFTKSCLQSIPGSPAPRYLSFSSTASFSSDEESSPPADYTSFARVQKMDKLRRTLGDGVPVELVFPLEKRGGEIFPEEKIELDNEPIVVIELDSETEKGDLPSWDYARSPSPSSTVSSSPESPRIDVSSKDLPPLPKTTAFPRDSMSFPSPHRARRSVKRKPVPSILVPSPRSIISPSIVSGTMMTIEEQSPTSPQEQSPMSIEELERAIDDDMQKLWAIMEDEIDNGSIKGRRWSCMDLRAVSLQEAAIAEDDSEAGVGER